MLTRITLFLLAIFSSATLFSQQQIRTGNFIANNSSIYPLTGGVEFVKEEDGSQKVNFKNDFATVQGIKLEVFLSEDAKFDIPDDLKISDEPIGMNVAMGIAITGPRSFTVPSDVDINTYSYVIVECTSANILWGYAELSILDGGNNGGNQTNNTWTVVDVDEGEKPTLQIDKNNIPHIAFMNESTTGGWTKIATLDGNTFSSQLVSEGYFYGPLDLAINNDNRALIAYHDHSEADGEYALAREMPSGDYNVEFIYSSGHDGWDNTIFLEADGTEHLLSSDSGSGEIEYAFMNNGSWQIEDVGIDQTSYKWAIDLAVVNDVVYAVAFQSQTGQLLFSKKENGNWTTEQITMSGRYPSLSVDASGDVLVAFYKRINANSGSIEVAHRGSVGWEFSSIDTLINHDSGFARDVVELIRNSTGTYVAYSDSDVFNLATANGDAWDIETVLDAKAESMTLRNQTSMDIDDEGYFHFATYRADVTATAGGRIMYITNKTLPTGGGGMMETQMMTKNINFAVTDSDWNDLPMAELVVTSVDGETTISQTAFGQYAVEALETSDDEIQVCVSMDTPAIDGLSSVDVVRGLRIVLGLVEPCDVNLIAADVDESGSVSSVDLVQMINVLIGKNDVYPNNPSWVFMIDGNLKSCETFSFATLPSALNITGIKKGNIECVDTPINLQDDDKNSIHWKK